MLSVVGCGGTIAAATESTEAASAVTLSEPVSRKLSSEVIDELSWLMDVCVAGKPNMKPFAILSHLRMQL